MPDIELVIQWRYVGSLATITQWLGRGACGFDRKAKGVYLVESKYFDGHPKKVVGVSGMKRKRKSGPPQVSKRQKTGLLALEHLQSESEDDDWGELENVDVGMAPAQMSTDEGLGGAEHGNKGAMVTEGEMAGGGHVAAAVEGVTSTVVQDNGRLPQTMNSLPKRGTMPNDEYEFAAMDAFINAKLRGFCRRAVLDEYFENNGKLGFSYHFTFPTHHFVAPTVDAQACCEQCRPKRACVCCDMCHPIVFPIADAPIKASRGKRKLKVRNFTMDEYNQRLRDGLTMWRKQQLKDEGCDGDDFFGPEILMSNDVRNQIVDLAHHGKIPNVKAIEEQTGWQYTLQYGQKILEIINIYSRPQALLPVAAPSGRPKSQALQGVDTNTTLPQPSTDVKRPRACGLCGSDKHIRTFTVSDFPQPTNLASRIEQTLPKLASLST